MTPARTILIALFLLAGTFSFSQSKIDSILDRLDPQKWSAAIEKEAAKLQEKIIARSSKTLNRLQKAEEKMYRKMLRGKDSLQAKAELAGIREKYNNLQNKIKNSSHLEGSKHYISKLDTLTTSLKFLDQYGVTGKVKNALTTTQSLQSKFQQAEEIKKFIRERKQQVKEQLSKMGLTNQLKRFNKEVYYYSANIRECRELLNDSKKAERKALELLGKTKLFKDFMQRNSMLASIFPMPGDPGNPALQVNLAGLQTRTQINNLIQQQIATAGPNAQQQLWQNIQDAQGKLDELKNKMPEWASNGDAELPEGFSPNSQKTKSFLQRFEFGTNFQSQRGNSFLPVTSDLGMFVSYNLNDKSIIGIGASYKMGWGKDIRHIQITHQGLGLRSFADWKLKKSFWLTGGYELNYRSEFSNIDVLKDLDAWQQSGLLGISKVISLKTKFFRKTKLQLLWDFLSYRQQPETQPIVFRVGYNF